MLYGRKKGGKGLSLKTAHFYCPFSIKHLAHWSPAGTCFPGISQTQTQPSENREAWLIMPQSRDGAMYISLSNT